VTESRLTALVAIATYRRPDSLRALLASLEPQVREHGAHVVVVDNDAAGSAATVAASSPAVTTYLIEPSPGIAEARNAALDRFDDRYDIILFIDDDETAAPGWLSAVLGFLQSDDADIALGAVQTDLAGAPAWVRRGGYLQRGVPPTGTACPSAATNNVAVRRRSWLAAGAPRFDPTFSTTGGSDTELFLRLTEAGLKIRFVAEAVMYEHLPPERMRARWILRRLVRNGIVAGRLTVRRRGRARAFGHGLTEIGSGIRRCLADLLRRRHIGATAARTLLMGVGECWSVFGGRIHEYRRPRARPS
jgi:glycosyltransferase involved in cell wall biosynthesis